MDFLVNQSISQINEPCCCYLTIAAFEFVLERTPDFPFLVLAFDEAGAFPSCFTVSAVEKNGFSFTERGGKNK